MAYTGELEFDLYDEAQIKRIGRTYTSGDSIWCGFSGSGIEISFIGTEAIVTLGGDEVSEGENDGNYARFAIYVNGERVTDDLLDAPVKSYRVFYSEELTEVHVRVIKLSETAMSAMAVCVIEAIGTEILPAAKKTPFIEFIGDSITCGYGVDDEDPEHHFSTATEDVTLAYAYRTAEALGAEYSMVSISGYGIISGYTEGDRIPEQTIPQYYESMGFSYGSFGGEKPQNIPWDFSSKPDLIVINLGTNDDSYCKDDDARRQEYTDNYVDFLGKVRRCNPDSVILCTLGIMGTRLCDRMEAAAARYSEQSGDTNIYTMRFEEQSEEDGRAADWHPTAKTHEKAAKKLADKIKEILNL